MKINRRGFLMILIASPLGIKYQWIKDRFVNSHNHEKFLSYYSNLHIYFKPAIHLIEDELPKNYIMIFDTRQELPRVWTWISYPKHHGIITNIEVPEGY